MEPVQLEFDFEFDELPPTRPLPYYPAPKNDNEKLLNWQYEYRIKGDEKALNKMYRLGEIIALRDINTVAKKNKAVAKLAQELPEVRDFVADFLPSYGKTLDELLERAPGA